MAASAPKVRFGILSTASIATKNVAAMKASGAVDVVAVGSRDLTRAQQWAAKHDVPVAYGSYDEVLADPSIDAVYIPLPTSLHKEWTVKDPESPVIAQAAAAGKHVLCEKPCAVSAAELRDMLAACDDAGVLFMDGVMFMHCERLGLLRGRLDDTAAVGELRRVTSAFTFCGDAEFAASNIRVQAGLEPAGCLGDLGWYCIRWALWAFHWDLPAHAAAVFHRATPSGVPTELTAELTWADGRTASFDCGFHTCLRQTAEAAGTRGFVALDDFVIPKAGAPAFTVVTDPRFSAGHRRAIADAAVVESHGAPEQEEAMFVTFARLAREMKAATAVDGASGADFWPRVSLLTQVVLDACMESGRRAGGMPVPIAPL